MKRLLTAGFLLFSIFLLAASVSKTSDQYLFSDIRISEADFSRLKENRIKTDIDLLKSVSFNDYPLFLDKPNSRWFYSINPDNHGADPSIGFFGRRARCQDRIFRRNIRRRIHFHARIYRY